MTKTPISLQDLRRSLYIKRRLNKPGVSGDYTSTSAKWRRFAKPMGWPRRTRGSRNRRVTFEAIEQAEWRVFFSRFEMN